MMFFSRPWKPSTVLTSILLPGNSLANCSVSFLTCCLYGVISPMSSCEMSERRVRRTAERWKGGQIYLDKLATGLISDLCQLQTSIEESKIMEETRYYVPYSMNFVSVEEASRVKISFLCAFDIKEGVCREEGMPMPLSAMLFLFHRLAITNLACTK